MENQVTNNANALRLFFQEDVFLVPDPGVEIPQLKDVKPVLSATEEKHHSTENIQIQATKEPESPQIPVLAVDLSTENSKKEDSVPVVKNFKYLGGNQKSVLILVNDASFDVSTEQGRELLRKIVKAIDLATPDFALLNYATHSGTSFTDFHTFFKPGVLLAFGVGVAELNLNLIWQNEIILHEGTQLIFAPNLHLLDADLEGKKSLWGNLKKLTIPNVL